VNSAPRDHGAPSSAGRFASLAGLGVGTLCGGVYWVAVQLWPSSVAVMLAILAGTLISNEMRPAAAAERMELVSQVFYVLIKYNVLMALSAAHLPFAAPANTTVGLIMICGYGASRALLVWMGSRAAAIPHLDLALAILIGFVPAVLLGVPGLIGLAAAVASVIALMRARVGSSLAPWITELCFYLGAQASWSYVQ